MLYKDQGRYADAEPLYKRSLAIREKALGPDHPDVATSLNNLAGCTTTKVAMRMPSRSTSDRWPSARKRSVPIIPMLRHSLNNLAALYNDQGRYADAEPLYKRSLAIRGEISRSRSSRCRDSLNNLAVLYHDQGRYADAEPLYKRSLAIHEKPSVPIIPMSRHR